MKYLKVLLSPLNLLESRSRPRNQISKECVRGPSGSGKGDHSWQRATQGSPGTSLNEIKRNEAVITGPLHLMVLLTPRKKGGNRDLITTTKLFQQRLGKAQKL